MEVMGLSMGPMCVIVGGLTKSTDEHPSRVVGVIWCS